MWKIDRTYGNVPVGELFECDFRVELLKKEYPRMSARQGQYCVEKKWEKYSYLVTKTSNHYINMHQVETNSLRHQTNDSNVFVKLLMCACVNLVERGDTFSRM